MEKTNYIIRPMHKEEASFAIDMAESEGWNPGLHDSECFYRTDPEGFFMGLLDGRPVACVSAVSYAGRFGFIGLYIVSAGYRRRGFGLKIWHFAMKHLAGMNIGLDAVTEQVQTYTRAGFRVAHNSSRYEMISEASSAVVNHAIQETCGISFDLIKEYDRQCFPAERQKFLEGWLTMPDSRGFGWIENNTLRGYGVIRKCKKGYKVGPLFADCFEVAESLHQSLTAGLEKGAPVYLDIPEPNSAALRLVRKLNMQKVFTTARMYTGDVPQINLNRVFGVTSFELG